MNLVRPGRRSGQEHLDWVPWLELIALADADPDQLAVLDGFRAQSPHFRLLARDARVLRERTATDKAIFYGHGGGLPRAERELSATVTSRLNGCVHCASVHSALSSQLSGRTSDVQRLLDEGVEVRIDARRDAITDFAAALSATPPRADARHVARLREVGVSGHWRTSSPHSPPQAPPDAPVRSAPRAQPHPSRLRRERIIRTATTHSTGTLSGNQLTASGSSLRADPGRWMRARRAVVQTGLLDTDTAIMIVRA